MSDWKRNLVIFGLLSAGGIVTAVGVYLLLRRVGEVEFQGVRVPITEEDKVWMGRMLVGEVGENPSRDAAAAVLWSVLTRWRSKPAFQGMTFTEVMRSFSQPINPIWAQLDACSSDGRGCCGTRCSSEQIARRARITNMPWSSIPQSIRDIVASFAAGQLQNPIPGYNNFAAAGSIGSTAYSELPAVTIGGNTFVRDQGSLQGEVRIV